MSRDNAELKMLHILASCDSALTVAKCSKNFVGPARENRSIYLLSLSFRLSACLSCLRVILRNVFIEGW